MKTKTTITESELNHCEALIEKYHEHLMRGQMFAERLAEVLGCSTDDAWDILERHDTMRNVLAKCATEIAPDVPQLRVVHPPSERDRWERIETIVVVLLAVCLFGVALASAWMWGE